MPDEPFVDTHAHFWDKAIDGLEWAWLEEGFEFRHLRGTEALDAPRYLPPEFWTEADGAGVGAIVHVHAAHPVDDPAHETAWLESVADIHGIPHAIVGGCTLGDPDAPELLARHARHARFRGVRDARSPQHLDPEEIGAAMEVLAERRYSVELRRSHEEFDVLMEVAARWPQVTVALSHACLPLERTSRDLKEWSAAMRKLAAHPNVVCKISTVAGASDPNWTVASIRPWILSCVESFGPDRCMLGSNWPVDRLFGTYRALIDGYREATSELDPSERAAVFHGTAERVYGLEPVEGIVDPGAVKRS